MGSISDAIWYLVTWVTALGCCPKCGALNGHQWYVPTLEAVMDIQGTYSHPHCKCELDVEFEIDPEKLQVWSA